MSINVVSNAECILCHNCELVCPADAVSFSKEVNLFDYPCVDSEKCIQCGLCERVCPSLQDLTQTPSISAYAAKNNNLEIRKKSSSGGVFNVLAEEIIRNGGLVCGAVFDSQFHVHHILSSSLPDIEKMRGSKYEQSRLENVFIEIKEHLKHGNTVLFTGTPCQSAALNVFLDALKVGKEKLFIMSFICHGILSEKLFEQYKQYLEGRRSSKITSLSFVCKDKYGWEDRGFNIVYANGKVDQWPYYEDIYMQGYFQAICMRESCYSCKYKNFYEGSDIIVGDIWGASQLIPDFYDDDGLSLVSVQTDKGTKLFEILKKQCEIKECDIQVLAKYNQGLFKPFAKGRKYAEYYQKFQKNTAFLLLKNLSRPKGIEWVKHVVFHYRRELRLRNKE